MTIRGDQQVKGKSFYPSDLCVPVLKVYEDLLFLAIAAAEGYPLWKKDASQAFLYASIGSDVVYTNPADWCRLVA
jgi:hypothetical protein